jgi:hypothetical protein
MMALEVMLHGVLQRYILMGYLWVECMHLHVGKDGLEDLRREAKHLHFRQCYLEQHV